MQHIEKHINLLINVKNAYFQMNKINVTIQCKNNMIFHNHQIFFHFSKIGLSNFAFNGYANTRHKKLIKRRTYLYCRDVTKTSC